MKQPSARLIINKQEADKSYILWNCTESYYKILRNAYQDIKDDNNSDYLFFGFSTLCAATLEYSLNFTLTNYCLNHFGHKLYKHHAKKSSIIIFRKNYHCVPKSYPTESSSSTKTQFVLKHLMKL
jgi:hypothetical protein